MARRAITILKKRKKLKQITLFCQEKEKQPRHAQPTLCPRHLPLPPLTVPEQLITNEDKEGSFSKELNRAGPFITEKIPPAPGS
jgi:hypothetical protein